MNRLRVMITAMLVSTATLSAGDLTINKKTDGYRGIWYFNQRIGGEYVYKYSGGLGTYCAKHKPFAVYCPKVGKTFFCYGGVDAEFPDKFGKQFESKAVGTMKQPGALYHLVSYFDHKTGMVPRPTVLLDKMTFDAHDNPVISVDDKGYIWIFSTAHGTARPAYVHKSKKPYDITEFELIRPFSLNGKKKELITNYSYMQAWHIKDEGFLYFFTKYQRGRKTCFGTSPDGVKWTWQELAKIQQGHYQISTVGGGKGAVAFNYHPTAFAGNKKEKGLNWRTNLYYMETSDAGKTFKSVDGKPIQLPVTKVANPGLVHDYEKGKLLVYLKDIRLDEKGNPAILFITSKGYKSGPANNPRTWRLARSIESKWVISDITTSDNNYDMGSLYLEEGGVMRVIAPTEPGPQPFNPGGEIAMWTSADGGATWKKQRQMTSKSERNHTYVRRPVNAHEDFYGFWADGHGRKPSRSNLYFCNKKGDVFLLPVKMDKDMQKPERVFSE